MERIQGAADSAMSIFSDSFFGLGKMDPQMASILGISLNAAQIVLWDADLKKREMNFTWCFFKHLGYSKDNLPENTLEVWMSHLHPEDKKLAEETYATYIRKEIDELPALRLRMRHKDGTYIYMLHSGEALYDENKEVVRLVGTTQNIHEQVMAEKRLEESRQFIRTVVNANPNMIFVKDEKGRFTFANEALAHVFNMSPEELLGKRTQDLHQIKEEVKHVVEQDEKVLRGTSIYADRQTYTDNKGETKHYQTLKVPIEFMGSRQILGIANDITGLVNSDMQIETMRREKENSDLQFELALEGMDFALYAIEWNRKKRNSRLITSTSDFINDYFSVEDWQKNFGANVKKYLHYIHPEDRHGFVEFAGKCLRDNARKVYHHTYRFFVDGTYRWQEDHVFTKHDKEYTTVYVLSKNVSERMEMEEKLKAAFEKERDLNKLKSQFVSMTSHEFRTPLTSIRSSIEILQMMAEMQGAVNQEKLEPLVSSILVEIDRLTELMNDVLILGKLDAEKVQLKRRPVQMDKLMSHVLYLERLQRDRDIQLSDETNGKEFMLDFTLISHVIRNLIQNAIKYGGKDKAPEFRAMVIENRLVMEVRDYGIGIPEQEQKNLFQSFFRASNAETIKGTGLGLVIVKEFVELHGGHIELESAQGAGSLFRLILPIEA